MPPGFVGNMVGFDQVAGNRQSILHKLESSNAITELGHTGSGTRGHWYFKTGINYKKVFNSYKKQYELAARQANKVQEYKEPNKSDIVYEIEYSEKNRQVLLNGLVLAKPDFDSENERFFTYVYSNPNNRITIKELRNAGIDFSKSLHKILENLGFTSDIKTVFFDVSKTSVRFKNPVHKKELDEAGISRLRVGR